MQITMQSIVARWPAVSVGRAGTTNSHDRFSPGPVRGSRCRQLAPTGGNDQSVRCDFSFAGLSLKPGRTWNRVREPLPLIPARLDDNHLHRSNAVAPLKPNIVGSRQGCDRSSVLSPESIRGEIVAEWILLIRFPPNSRSVLRSGS